jgi:hypothetical protein
VPVIRVENVRKEFGPWSRWKWRRSTSMAVEIVAMSTGLR